MNHDQVAARIGEQLLADGGWVCRHAHHFRHPEARVSVMVYGSEVDVVFGQSDDGRSTRVDLAVSASYRHYPTGAIASVVAVARAMVVTRLAARADPAETG